MYIFRDIYTGKIYRVYANSAREAKVKLSQLANIPQYNLARVKPQERKEYA